MSRLNLLLTLLAFTSPVSLADNDLQDGCEVTNVNAYVNSGNLYVTWLNPNAETCPNAQDYRLEYKIDEDNYGPMEPIQPGGTIAMTPIQELFCEKVSVEIQTMDKDLVIIGSTGDVPLERSIPSPNGIEVNVLDGKVRVEWDDLWDKTKTECQVSYTITFGDNILTTEENYIEIESEDLKFCATYAIEVIASSNGFTSSTTFDYKINLPKLKIVKSDSTSVIFEPLEDIPIECGDVSYKIIERNYKCLTRTYTVKAASLDYESDEAITDIQQLPPGPVRNLIAEIVLTKIHLRWNPPSGLIYCDVEYEIQYDGDSIQTDTTTINLDTTLIPCVAKPLEISAVLKGVKGEPSPVTVYGNIGPVKDLKCSATDENVKCSWTRPDNSDNCNELQYQLKYYNGNDFEFKETTELYFDTLPYVICSSNWVSVEPFQKIDGYVIKGTIIETNIEGCSQKVW